MASQMLARSTQRHQQDTSTSTRSGIALKQRITQPTCSAVSQMSHTRPRHWNTFCGHSSGTVHNHAGQQKCQHLHHLRCRSCTNTQSVVTVRHWAVS